MWILASDNKTLVNLSDATTDIIVLNEDSITARTLNGGNVVLYKGENVEAVWDRLGGSIAASLNALFVSRLAAEVATTVPQVPEVPQHEGEYYQFSEPQADGDSEEGYPED